VEVKPAIVAEKPKESTNCPFDVVLRPFHAPACKFRSEPMTAPTFYKHSNKRHISVECDLDIFIKHVIFVDNSVFF